MVKMNDQIKDASAAYLVDEKLLTSSHSGEGGNLIPMGYKRTEIGVLPEAWRVAPLGTVLKEKPKYGINAAAVPLYGNLPVYIRITDISEDGHYLPDEKVGVDSPFSEAYKLSDGDIVLARTGASVGKSYAYKLADGELVYAGFLIKITPNQMALSTQFLAQYLQTETYWSWVVVNSMRSGQPGINGNEYASLLVPVPSLKEQIAIANVLSDVDALIDSLEALISKKQAIKTATMQELLTGRTRLPGFAGEWKSMELKRLVQTPITDGPHMTPHFLEGGVPFLSVNNLVDNRIDLSDLRYISKADDEVFAKKCKPRKGDVLLGKAASVGKVALVENHFDFNIWSPIALIRVNDRITAKFLYYQLQGNDCVRQIVLLTNSSSQGNIGMGDIEKLQISFPSPDEQTAIADVLYDMDTEILTLKQRLLKVRQLKQGMMQELLTGRTRLVQSEDIVD